MKCKLPTLLMKWSRFKPECVSVYVSCSCFFGGIEKPRQLACRVLLKPVAVDVSCPWPVFSQFTGEPCWFSQQPLSLVLIDELDKVFLNYLDLTPFMPIFT